VSVAQIPRDLEMAAAILAVVQAVQLLWPRGQMPALQRIAIYATAIFPAYLLVSDPDVIPHLMLSLAPAVIVILALMSVAYVRFGSAHRFGTTPTDYLIVCGVLALAVFGSIEANSRNVVEAVLFSTVIMYACEIILGSPAESPSRRVLQYSTLGTLLIITLRGVL
jgi:hypothetical protein